MPSTQQSQAACASQRVNFPVNAASNFMHAPGIDDRTFSKGDLQAWLSRIYRLLLARPTMYNSP